jgi:hypothetical protein
MNDLTKLMERTTQDLLPDVQGLVSGGIQRGRRLRTRRRLAAGAGAAAAVAAIGSVAVLAPSLVAGSSSTPGGGGAGGVATQPTAPAPKLPTAQELGSGAIVTLPAGRSKVIEAWGTPAEGHVAAAWKFTPASGGPAARVDVLIENSAQDLKHQAVPGEACQADGGRCRQLPDGTWLDAFTIPEPLTGGGDSDIVGAHVTVWTVDGFRITATAYNAMGEKHVAPTRPAPVLNEAQLTAMVRATDLG